MGLTAALKQDQEEKRHLQIQVQSIEALRNQVILLQQENEELKNTTRELVHQTRYLMKSHKRESELAIRRLLDDAQSSTDKSTLISEAKTLVSKYYSRERDNGNI